jgi:hypothetical protein
MSNNRPYGVHRLIDPAGTTDFMERLKDMGLHDADPVGVAVDEEQVILAQEKDVYILPRRGDGDYARFALAAAIMGASPPRLVALDAAETLVGLMHALGEPYPAREFFLRLSMCMLGDLRACAYNTGGAPAPTGISLQDQAFTARLLEPQLQFEAPNYYFAVSIPLARLRAEWRLFGMDAPPDWWVSYSDLWLHTLRRYTGDPTLEWLFTSGHDPLTGLAGLFEWPPDVTKAVLLWHICGRSVDVMAGVDAVLVDRLPDNLPAVGDQWNKRLPSLWLGIITLMQAYQRDRLARTLYGRKLHGGLHPGVASAHTILGTVTDIMEVAGVTFGNNRPGPAVMIQDIETDPLSDLLRVTGTGPKNTEESARWIEILTDLATLANPLGLEPLRATVVQPPPVAQAKEALTSISSGDSGTTPTTTIPRKRVRGASSTGIRTPKRRRTRPRNSSADPKPSRAPTAKPKTQSCGSSPKRNRRRSSGTPT